MIKKREYRPVFRPPTNRTFLASTPSDQTEAKRRYDSGEVLKFSTNMDGDMTYGYGRLDNFGYWQYPLRYQYLRPEHKQLVDAHREARSRKREP